MEDAFLSLRLVKGLSQALIMLALADASKKEYLEESA